MPLQEFIEKEMDQTLHEILRRNVITATRNYQARVQALMKEIIRHQSNPLCVKHFATKLEFQARGAGHNHGVLWLDINRLEQKADVRQFRKKHPENDSFYRDPVFVPELNTFLINCGLTVDKNVSKEKKHKALRYLDRLEAIKEKVNLTEDHNRHIKELRDIFPLYGLKKIFKKLQQNDEVSEEELEKVALLVDSFSTVSLHPAIVGSLVAEIAKKVNQHNHTHTCKKYKTICRFKMPKLPSYRTLIARPPSAKCTEEEKNVLQTKYELILSSVRKVLENKDVVNEILEKFPKEKEGKTAEADEGRRNRIDTILNKAGLTSKEEKEDYEKALAFSLSGFTVVYARDIDELMVNPYNPEITLAWDGNTDFQFCFDFYAIITYITEYFTKDDNGVMKIMVDTMKASNSADLKDQMTLLMNTWIKNRQMGEAEAVYHLNREFKFRDSDTMCIFVQTCKRSERSKILKNVTEKPEFTNFPKIMVENHVGGEYIEQYDVNSKYERRDIEGHPELDDLSFSHMSKMYSAFWGTDKGEEKQYHSDNEDEEEVIEKEKDIQINRSEPHDEEFDSLHEKYPKDFDLISNTISDEKFKFVMKYPLKEGEGKPLPKVFKLKSPFPGEPPFMKLRTKPSVLRFHKYNAEKDPEAYWYSEALLYLPHRDEDDLQQKLNEAKENVDGAWGKLLTRISHVKSQVMEYIEENEEARIRASEMFINNITTGESMDPQGEQENEDDRLDTVIQQEEFQYLDPEFSLANDDDAFEKSFRPIEVRPLQEIKKSAIRLYFYQRKVLEIGVRHARGIVKARGGKNPPPQLSPLIMVDGAAGAGKSCTINILKEIVSLILQQPGDNPECPYIVLCAPTGCAAVNINGQTLHTALSFTWGNQHLSLNDKTRDTKRALFKNLKFLIVDEISMVRSDQLYQIDLRLRELTMQPNKLFGGVAVFVFGDIMQLRPVQGRYIWAKPQNPDFHQAFSVKSHWEQFEVVSLVENHRQEDDKEYANILNRIRVGEITDCDMKILQERVRSTDHPDLQGATVIACQHIAVNKHNSLSMQQIDSELIEIQAINTHDTIPNFRPKIDAKKGTVGSTSYVQSLQIKLGCRLMIIDNLDINDQLCNGSTGTLRATVRDNKREIQYLMIELDNRNSGREMRRCHPHLLKSFPGLTPLKKQIFSYPLTAKAKGARCNLATVQQFPVIVSFASTTHKIQGQTIIAEKQLWI